MVKHKKNKPMNTAAAARPAPPLVDTVDILTSFAERLSELRQENAEVMKRAQRNDARCSALDGDVALAMSRLAAENAERDRLRLERDDLARQVAELKHRERRRAHNKSEQAPPSIVSPVSVKEEEKKEVERVPVRRPRTVSTDDGDIYSSTDHVEATQDLAHVEQVESVPVQRPHGSTDVVEATQDEDVSTWKCAACTYENSLSVSACEMCGTQMSAVVDDSTPPIVSLILEMGYTREAIEEAIEALDEADKDKPEAVIFWIDEKIEKAKVEQQCLKQEKMEKERLNKEREANERAARKKAKKEAEKKARLEAEQAEERKAREEAERVRREAREAKERARWEAEQESYGGSTADIAAKMPIASSSVPSLPVELSLSSNKKPSAAENGPMRSTAQASARSSKTSSASTALVKPQFVSSRKTATTTTVVPVDKLSQYMYPDTPGVTGKEKYSISPIFGMLQDKSTIEAARMLLSLEDRCARLKKEAGEISREKESHARNIAALQAEEAGLHAKLEARVKRIALRVKQAEKARDVIKSTTKVLCNSEIKKLEAIEKKKRSTIQETELKKWYQNLATIERAATERKNSTVRAKEEEELVERERVRIEAAIDDLLPRSEAIESRLAAKLKQVEKERDEIVLLKRSGEEEDARFDINGSRDERGRTFLIVAAQNNDLGTARLCFQLGANPSIKSSAGLTPMEFAQYFKLEGMVDLIAQNGGTEAGDRTWSVLAAKAKNLHPIDWETQLLISERAAIPADTKLSSDEDPTSNETALLEANERSKEFSCFDASLLDPGATNFRRVVLLEKDVYAWFSEADATERSGFRSFLAKLQSAEDHVSCHRRFIVGIKREKQFEVLCAELSPVSHSAYVPVAKDTLVAFYSPFVESAIGGVANIGVLLWAVTTESRASRYISLIEAAEFLRHKVDDPNERFPAHRDDVLELGKDMHLLDLKATSIFTGSAMELLTVNVDKNDLYRMENEDFIPPKRLLHHEQQLQQAIFRSSEKESSENQGILSMARPDLSSHLFGGAGTGKTLLLIKKVISEDVNKRILVVSRLSRLISFVKSAVDAERDSTNVAFFTYDDLLNHLSRRVEPSDPAARRMFAAFNQVHFGQTTGTGAASSISFEEDFVHNYLEAGERNAMKKHMLEPITLWGAFRVIKSNVKCSETKAPLSQDDYISLPRSFGLNEAQRALVYKLYERYSEWLSTGTFKWDEADRVLYIFRWGFSVFAEKHFVSWEQRAFQRGEMDLLEDDEMPLSPFFYHMVFADEAQDFSDLDMALFIRMSSSVRNLFLGADPAQSVELGIHMRVGTVNGVFHSSLPKNQKNLQVKDVVQDIQLKTNHRTHARNLAIGKAVRRILARSFDVQNSNESALMEGPMPEAIVLESMRALGDDSTFRAGNVVFICPDEMVSELRSLFLELGVKNDVFGVREAKGLEFPSIALVGFFEHFQQLGNQRQWENVIRWLFSTKGITTKESGEKFQGKSLENCDYILSHPEVEDQAMMLYTALTRARGQLYFIEVVEGKKRNSKGGLGDFAFRQFQELRLLKLVSSIDEGDTDMTPQQHKARGVLLVVQAINMSRNNAPTELVKEKFADACSRFQVDTGNDQHLLDQCNKHVEAILMKRALAEMIRTTFFNKEKGEYDLEGRFESVLRFEQEAAKFFRLCANDSFLVEEIQEMRALIEDVFFGTPYEIHFGEICSKIKKFES